MAAIFFALSSAGQMPSPFEVTETIAKKPRKQLREYRVRRASSAFFEDENYTASRSCAGEFGGRIWFTDKKTDVLRYCDCTCPVAVNRLDGKYIVTCALAHMRGSSRIIEIAQLDSLALGERQLHEDGFTLLKPKESYDKLISTRAGVKEIGLFYDAVILMSFHHNGQLYHIVDGKTTYIATVKAGEFVVVDTLVPTSNFYTGKKAIITTDGHHVFFFEGERKGHIDVYGNKVDVVYYQ